MSKEKTEAEKTDDYGAPVIHEYDGIEECDNHLPRWWLFTLYGAIAFAVVYWMHFHTLGTGQLPSDEFAAQKAAELAEQARQLAEAGEVTDDALLTMAQDPGTVEKGKNIFTTKCVLCHADKGQGNVGPNLTDEYWLHGGQPMDIYRIVRDGYLENQMPAWEPQIGEVDVRAVTAFVLTIRGTKVPGKEPQGELMN